MILDNSWHKESAPKESHAVSSMTSARYAKVNANVIDQVLLHRNNDHKAKTVKMEKVHQKVPVSKGTSWSGEQNLDLPEQTVAPTDVRRSMLKKSGKRSPIAHSDTPGHKDCG